MRGMVQGMTRHRTRLALAAAALTAAIAACGTPTPTTADLSVAASDHLAATVEDCYTAAAERFPGYAEAPARAVAEMGCERNTCESLRQYVNASQWATRDPRFGVEASEWLEANRYIATGCREVQARIEAVGGPARYDAGTR